MTENSINGPAFVARLQAREHEAFCLLVQQFQRPLLRFASALVGQKSAEDVVQDAWIAAYKALPGFEGRSSISTWLYTIVRHACIARLKKDSRMVDVSTDAPAGPDQIEDWFDNSFQDDGHWKEAPGVWGMASPEAMLEESQLQHCIEAHLNRLPRDQQAVFRLRELEQHEMQDVCNILDLSSSNARVLLHRARLKLLQIVDHYQQTGEC